MREPEAEPQQSNIPNLLWSHDHKPLTTSLYTLYFQSLKQKMSIMASVENFRRKTNQWQPSETNPQVSSKPAKYSFGKKGDYERAQQKANYIYQKMDEHKISLEELCDRLETNPQFGLTTEIAMRRNTEEGDNIIPERIIQPPWMKFLQEVTNQFSNILWLASIICIAIYVIEPIGNLTTLYLSFVLMYFVQTTGAITFIQRKHQSKILVKTNSMLPQYTNVLRDGNIISIQAKNLVRGDIVKVKIGEKIPADIRIIQSHQMKVDKQVLTGSTEPFLVSPECSHPAEPLETTNLVFFGTRCQEGDGMGIVLNIGKETIMGHIDDLIGGCQRQKIQRTALRIELDRLMNIIAIGTVSVSVVFVFLAIFVTRYSGIECLKLVVNLLIACVPESLLACITVCLAITARKLQEKQILVNDLETVETLGLTSCICSGKTGTLTKNKMTVENLWYDCEIKRGHNKELEGDQFEYDYDVEDPTFKILHHTAMICSSAKFNVTPEDLKEPGFKYTEAPVIGDATEAALIKFYQPIEQITSTRGLYLFGTALDDRDSKFPFNSNNKYSLSIVKSQGPEHQYISYMMGAPEIVWKHCGKILQKGRQIPIGLEEQKRFEQTILNFGKKGERVIGFAMLPLNKQLYHKGYKFNTSTPDSFNFPIDNYNFIGLISMVDPPKQSVPLAIKRCQLAGIKIIMVTGDHPSTATAFAKKIGIVTNKTNEEFEQDGYSAKEALKNARALVIHGDKIVQAFQQGDQKGEKTLNAWVNKPEIVFARTTPAQKLQIIKACQDGGKVVCVTGNGVNDCPAIKQGDIGVSMGISGSSITKELADMILLDDDFASIIDGVEEGRKVADNIKKIIVYLLTSNMAELWPLVGLVFFRLPLPLSNIFMLCICVGTDIYPAISLACEEAQADIMTRRPKRPDGHLVTTRLMLYAYGQVGAIATAGGFFTYFVVMDLYGFPPQILFGLVSSPTANPYVKGQADAYYNQAYTFDPLANDLGCPNLITPCKSQYIFYNQFPNWLSTMNANVDLRAFYSDCENNGAYVPNLPWPAQEDTIDTISPISGQPVRYTVEALFYAQSAYFVTVVMVQWSNVFACKSKKVSLIYSEVNKHMFYGILTETVLFVLLLYVPEVNAVFGGRPLNFFLLGIPGLGFSMMLLCWEETRKLFINMSSRNSKIDWFDDQNYDLKKATVRDFTKPSDMREELHNDLSLSQVSDELSSNKVKLLKYDD